MTEKVYYCYKCDKVHKNPEEIICPNCGLVCKKIDYIPKEDFPAYFKDLTNDNKKWDFQACHNHTLYSSLIGFKSMKGREAQIKETIESKTDRRYEIIESKEKLIVRFKKTNEESDNKLREELEKELLKFHPRILFINFF